MDFDGSVPNAELANLIREEVGSGLRNILTPLMRAKDAALKKPISKQL